MSSENGEPAGAQRREAGLDGLRKVTDVRTLRALTHPVRIALIEALTVYGAMTATEVGERIGESPTTCSFHLRQLARYGFVQEAGGGKGRARPWRMSSVGMSLARNSGDPEADLASAALSRLLRDRQLSRYQAWHESRHAFPAAWQRAAFDDQWLFYLTPDELDELAARLRELLLPWFQERITDPGKRPEGAVPVEMLLIGFPLEMPAREASGPEAGADQTGEGETGAAR
jgi:hypothetical protein